MLDVYLTLHYATFENKDTHRQFEGLLLLPERTFRMNNSIIFSGTGVHNGSREKQGHVSKDVLASCCYDQSQN